MYGGDKIQVILFFFLFFLFFFLIINNKQGTRILYPNGEIDPWHALGVLSPPNDQEPILWVKAASHHFWTHPSLETDDIYTREARTAIWNQVNAWLAEK